jgi:hypothetical protein
VSGGVDAASTAGLKTGATFLSQFTDKFKVGRKTATSIAIGPQNPGIHEHVQTERFVIESLRLRYRKYGLWLLSASRS